MQYTMLSQIASMYSHLKNTNFEHVSTFISKTLSVWNLSEISHLRLFGAYLGIFVGTYAVSLFSDLKTWNFKNNFEFEICQKIVVCSRFFIRKFL